MAAVPNRVIADCHLRGSLALSSSSISMSLKISSFAALVFVRAVWTLPQGELGDLLWPKFDVPEIDDPEPNEPEPSFWATYYTEPASTPSRVEHLTPLLHQLSSSATRLATPIVGTSTLSHLIPTSRLPTPTLVGHTTQTSLRTTSTSPNTILPTTSRPSSAELPPRNDHADIWRVVGIAVIAVSVVGTTILAIVFFDQWWSFLGDVCGRRKRRKSGKEELVPDWERRSWQFRVEDNLPAYPSFGSPSARLTIEEAASQTQSPRVGMRHPSPLSDCSNIPPVRTLSENCQRADMRSSPYEPTRSSVRRMSPGNEVMVHTSHYTLNRSDSQKTTTSEDAYGGLAVE